MAMVELSEHAHALAERDDAPAARIDPSWLTRVWHANRKLRLVLPALNARWHLRCADSFGTRAILRGRARVVNHGAMTFGDRLRLDSTVAQLELMTLPTGRLEVGDDVFINFGTSIVSSTHIKVGNHVLIGAHVMIMDCDFHRVEDKSWDTNGKPVILEDRVWIANRATILKGVRIGHDAVVAAGAVVTRNVPPRTVVAGVPAKVIRRF